MTLEEKLHNLDAVQVRLSISRNALYDLIALGEIKSVKIGRRRLIAESAVQDYLARLQATA